MFKLFAQSAVIVFALVFGSAQAGLISIPVSGHLIFVAVEGHGGTSEQEFGIIAPGGEREMVFTLHLVDGNLASTSPQPVVDMGLFSAGTSLDFYNVSWFDGPKFAFSANLAGSPTPSDLVVFTDRDNSLGLGGGVVEVLGDNHWLLHLDDAASFNYDDDDNELIIDVRVIPSVSNSNGIPEPRTYTLLLLGLGAAVVARHRQTTRMLTV